MKNTKLSSIILAVITIVSLILDTVDLQPFGFSTETVGKIAGVLTILKLVYDNWHLFSKKELVSFGNFVMKQDVYKSENVKGNVTHADLANWKLEKDL